MSTVHRQLRDWCRWRQYEACEDFATALDDELRESADVDGETLLAACRRIHGTRFFAENRLEAEEVAEELASYLRMPLSETRLKSFTPEQPRQPRDIANPTDTPPDLFLSYYHEDRKFVERLGSEVANAGHLVWYDALGITAGSSFPRGIERALEVAGRIGVVCTPISLERPWVIKEIEAGHIREGEERRHVLLPIRLQACKVPLLMRGKNWCDFVSSFDEGLGSVLEALEAGTVAL